VRARTVKPPGQCPQDLHLQAFKLARVVQALADVARHKVRPNPDSTPAFERDREARHGGELVFLPGEEGGFGTGGGRAHEPIEVGHSDEGHGAVDQALVCDLVGPRADVAAILRHDDDVGGIGR